MSNDQNTDDKVSRVNDTDTAGTVITIIVTSNITTITDDTS
jgi:hypothetical protein